MSKPRRTFTVQPGRSLVLPVRYGAAPGGGAAAYRAGESFDVDAALVDRFIRNRVSTGDIAERKPGATAATKE